MYKSRVIYTYFRGGKFVDDSGKSSTIFLGRLHDIDKTGDWLALGFNFDGVCETEVLIIHSKFLQGVDLPVGEVIQLRSREALEIVEIC